MHTEPPVPSGPQKADRAWRLLATLAVRAPRAVRLTPGAGKADSAAWGVPLPADVHRLARRVRGFRIGEREEYRLAPEHGLAPGSWATGPAGTAHLVHRTGHDTLFADVDSASGAWGRLFASTADFHETWAYVAPSLVEWVAGLAEAGLAALDAGADHDALLERLGEAAHVVSYRPDLSGTTVERARREAAGTDPELTVALAGLPDDALVVDLRETAAPATLHLPCPPGLRGCYLEFQRRHGGRFAIGVPRPGDREEFAEQARQTSGQAGQASRSTTTGAWSEAPLPLRSSRST